MSGIMTRISNGYVQQVGYRSAEAALGRVLFGVWVALFVVQFLELSFDHLRYAIWSLTIILLLFVIRRILKRARVQFPSKTLMLPIVLVILWRMLAVSRSTGELREISISFGDFLCVILVCVIVVPNLFSMNGWLKFISRFYVIVFLISAFLQPYVHVNKTAAGWDKGLKWAFTHPNTAAMFGLTIFLTSMVIVFAVKERIREKFVAFIFISISSVAIILTNARTAEGAALAAIAICLFGIVFGRLWKSHKFEWRALRHILVVGIAIIVVVATSIFGYQISMSELDEFTSGRLLFGMYLISTVPNILLGVGYLTPGTNLLYDIEDYGAGIDGLYVNILYTEGVVGLLLFAMAFLVLVKFVTKYQGRTFPYLIIFPVAAFLNGLTETTFWLLPSPITIATLGVGAIAATTRKDSSVINVKKNR